MDQTKNPQQTLLGILEIVGFEGDKDEFAAKFLELAYKQAVAKYYTGLPEDQKKALDTKLSSAETAQTSLGQLSQDPHFPAALQTASESMLTAYIEEITPSLNDDQKAALQSYLDTLAGPAEK